MKNPFLDESEIELPESGDGLTFVKCSILNFSKLYSLGCEKTDHTIR